MRGAYTIAHSGIPVNGGGWNNQQLLKDCGLVPYLLQKNHGFHSVLVGMRFDENYPYLEKYVSGLELNFLPEDTLQVRLAYVDAYAADMDLLILYGANPPYIPLVDYYKKVRPDGKVYLATDMNIGWGSRIPHTHPDYNRLFQSCDVVAASCRAAQKYIATKWRVPVELIRNGWYNFPQVSFDNLFEQKENVILTVGHVGGGHGGTQKQTHILLEAFAKVANDLPDWSVRLVGGIAKKFNSYIEKYFDIHPELKERVTFAGYIEDKTELANEYKRAKIFCMMSTFEGGTPNVTAEALFAGDFVVFSNVDAAYEATDDNKCGRVFPIGDVDALAKIFLEVCPNADLLLKGGQHAFEYARRNFDAEHIVAIDLRLYTDWQLKNRAVEDLNRQIQILLQDLNNL